MSLLARTSPAKHAALPKQISDVIGLSDQLMALLNSETEALRKGNSAPLTENEAQKSRLMALYQREFGALRTVPDIARTLNPHVRDALSKATARLQSALKEQSQLIARRKHVTEGIIQAVAKSVASKRQGASPYQRPIGAQGAPRLPARAATAITLNAVY
ncbi:MAG TPA: hypothetical protein DCL54_18500 [Alphaproteobacteria bacterium]|nr:hypothetical protein [Alphaproteobacteria bacterium]HAJ48573.1 hypothetical protein [Alphaproteobacteria bacterium]